MTPAERDAPPRERAEEDPVYQPTNEPREFLGQSRAEAVAKAQEFFGMKEDALLITELRASDVHGLAGRALVVVVPRERAPRPPRTEGGAGGGRRGGEGRGGEGRGRGGEGRGRGERQRGPASAGPAWAPEPKPAPAPAPAAEPSVATVVGNLGPVGSFLRGAIERMELGPFQISESEEDGTLAFRIEGVAAGHLSEGDGRPVDALQLLANQVASRDNEDPPRVVLDIDGDTDAREDRLERLAQRVAKRAREAGRAVRLDPMNGRDRRIIHLALRDEEDIATMSIGEGRYRQVLVVPAGAPEFEDAKRESEQAAQRRAD
jgi:spoIIIJ-associated protein